MKPTLKPTKMPARPVRRCKYCGVLLGDDQKGLYCSPKCREQGPEARNRNALIGLAVFAIGMLLLYLLFEVRAFG